MSDTDPRPPGKKLTPVGRALLGSNKKLLLALFVVGLIFGWVYDKYWKKPAADAPAQRVEADNR